MAAHSSAGPGVLTTLLPFLTGLTGAILAFAAATWRDRVTRGRLVADDLRLAFEEFHKAATAYVSSWSASRPDEQVRACRGSLLAQLARVRAAHRRWARVRAVEDELTTGELGEGLTRDWTGPDRARSVRLTTRLNGLRESLFDIAHAVEHPSRPHRAMRSGTGGST